MTDKKRKILSCVLICISIIVIFAGCKNNKTDTAAADISKEVSATTQNVDDKTTVAASATDKSTSSTDKTTGTTSANSKNANATTQKAVKKTTTKNAKNKKTTASKKNKGKTTTSDYPPATTQKLGKDFMTDIIDSNAVVVFNKKTGQFKIDCHGNFFPAFALEFGNDLYYNKLNGEEFDGNNVKSIYFKDGVTVIGYNPISYFVNATEVTIPKSTKRILRNTFPSSMKIKTINYGGSKEDWKKILIDNGNNEAIQNCKSINYNAKIEKSTVSNSTDYYFNQRYKTKHFRKGGKITVKLDYYTGVVTVSGNGPTDDTDPLDAVSIPSKLIETPSDWSEGILFPTINTLKYKEGITVITSLNCNNSSAYTVYIPKSVKTIEESAFLNNDYLKNVYYAGTEKQWKEIKIAKKGNEDLLNAAIHFG